MSVVHARRAGPRAKLFCECTALNSRVRQKKNFVAFRVTAERVLATSDRPIAVIDIDLNASTVEVNWYVDS